MKYISLLVAALCSGAVGCQKANTPPGPTLTASLEALNEKGQRTTVFAQGQNIIFRFQIVNNSDQPAYLSNPVFDPTSFLAVYNREGVSFGKPYSYIFCTYQGFYEIPARQTLTFSIPWVEAAAFPTIGAFCGHAATTYLPVGHYRTRFAPSFTWSQNAAPTTPGPQQTTAPQELNYEFEVR